MSCFPFLQALVKGMRAKIEKDNEERPPEEADFLSLHLLAEKEWIETLNLLPFQAYYHELSEEDVKNVFSAHRAMKNLKLESVDIYICLTDSLVDASMGKSLGASVKAGFSGGKNALLFNRKTGRLKGRHLVEQYHALLPLLLDQVPEEPAKGFSRELTPLREDWRDNPYYVVNLSAKDGEIEQYWKEFFSFVEGENFVLVCDGLESQLQRESLTEFLKTLNAQNVYSVFELEDMIEFAKLVAYSQSFITIDSPLAHIAAYCGGHTHFLRKNEPIQKSGPVYFLGEVRYFNLNEPYYREGASIAYHKVFDEIFKFIDAKAKEREK